MQRIGMILSVAILATSSVGVRAAEDQPLDNNFLTKASSYTYAEMNAAKLAEKHAASSKVKTFAAEMVQEHQVGFDRLAEVIKNRKIGVVTGLEKDVKAEMDHLSKLQGSDFDREYLKWVIRSHEKAILMLQAQIDRGKDADTVALAKEGLPKVEHHLKRAQELSKNLGS